MITINLNLRVKAQEREFLEKILRDLLAQEGLGVVDGGETFYNDQREIVGCSIIVKLHQFNRQNIERAILIIQRLRVPKGSWVEFLDKKINIGTMEGLALYLNGRDLSPAVYRSCNVNVVATETKKAMDGVGTIYSEWVGGKYTAIYYYGNSFEDMRNAILNFVSTYPLCSECKIQKIA